MASKLLGSLRVRLLAETQDFRRGMDAARKRVDTFDKRMQRFSREIGAAQVLAFGAVVATLKKSIDVANEYDASQRQLAASAKLSGTSLDYLKSISQQAESQFKLTTLAANGFTIELSKLANKAGDISKTSDALAAFLDIGAARGLTSAQTLQAVKQSILGIDEGTDKLFNANPSVLYAQFAKSIGTTAGKLTDAQKAQAILNAALRDGAVVRGSYQKFLESAAGQQELLNNSLSKTASALGHALQPVLVAVLPILAKLSDALAYAINALVAWGRAIAATFKLIPAYFHAAKMVFTDGALQGTNAWHLALDQWKLDLHDILIGAGKASDAMANIPPLPNPGNTGGTGTGKTPKADTYNAVAERADILTQNALERTRMYADLAEKRLGTEGSIADKLVVQLALVEQLWNVQRNAVLADTRLTDAQRQNELLRVDLEHEREGIQARLNAQLDEELAKRQAIAEAARRRNDALKAGASAIVGNLLSGHPSGGAIGAGIGTAFSWVPGIGQFLSGIGGFLGGLFDKGNKPNEPPPVIKSLAAIERAQRDTITAIRTQTDTLLRPENRFFNLPSTFAMPSYAPAFGGSGGTTYGDTHVNVSLTLNGDTNGMTPADIKQLVAQGMGEALYQMRNRQAWN